MATKIRMARGGKKKRPYYRIVVADSRAPRDGKFIERIGSYDPLLAENKVVLDSERAKHWLDRGAQPSERVSQLMAFQGIEHKMLVLPDPEKIAARAAEHKAAAAEKAEADKAAAAEKAEADKAAAAEKAEADKAAAAEKAEAEKAAAAEKAEADKAAAAEAPPEAEPEAPAEEPAAKAETAPEAPAEEGKDEKEA